MCKQSHHGEKDWKGGKKLFKMSLGGLFLGSLLVMVLWNAVMPDLFGLPHLGYWQAFAVLFLSRLLFGGHHHPAHHHCGHEGMKGKWRAKFEAKMKEHCDKHGEKSPEEEAKDERFKRGFTSGKWDVNVIDVEDEEEEKKDDGGKKPDEGEAK